MEGVEKILILLGLLPTWVDIWLVQVKKLFFRSFFILAPPDFFPLFQHFSTFFK